MSDKKPAHYAEKHPAAAGIAPKVRQGIQEKAAGGHMSCAAAHTLAGSLGVSPGEVGMGMDLMEVKISKCQLGLFGYSPNKKIVKAPETCPPSIAEAVRAEVRDGRISCEACWKIAGRLGASRLDVSGVVEALQLKVRPCQLGAF